MMRGGDINLIKTRRIGPESVEYTEGFLDKFAKNLMDAQAWRPRGRRKARQNKVKYL
jgi:hypothetical protein